MSCIKNIQVILVAYNEDEEIKIKKYNSQIAF